MYAIMCVLQKHFYTLPVYCIALKVRPIDLYHLKVLVLSYILVGDSLQQHIATLILCIETVWCFGMLTNQKGQMHHYRVTLYKPKNPPRVPPQCLLFIYPPVSSRLVVPNCPFGAAVQLYLWHTLSLYSSSQESQNCPRYAPHLPIFRNRSKHVVNHVCAMAVILPTYLTLLGPVFRILMLLH